MFSVRITAGSPTPIYQQIVMQIRHAIATEALETGELVPSVRALAEQLLINPNTVAKAYSDLSKDGLLEPLPGRGLAVAARRAGLGLTKPERLRRLDPLLSQLLNEAVAMDLAPADLHDLIDKKFKSLTTSTSKD